MQMQMHITVTQIDATPPVAAPLSVSSRVPLQWKWKSFQTGTSQHDDKTPPELRLPHGAWKLYLPR
jgi:hypothetical protein